MIRRYFSFVNLLFSKKNAALFGLLQLFTLSTLAQPLQNQMGGVVATSHPLATEAGVSVLRAGGNAIDAAAAVQFALNVVEPQSSGIGGGAFILVYLAKTHQIYAVDARESAPQLATADQFIGHDFAENSTSGISVGVPGTLLGFNEALKRWGKLTLGQVLQPAIHLARDGFVVTPYLAHSLERGQNKITGEARARFFNQEGLPLQVGQRLVQPELAHTFSILATEGVTPFYRGAIAQAIVATQHHSSMGPQGWGRMTLSDLEDYKVLHRQPLKLNYREYQLVGMPPPSSGASTVFEALKLLEKFSSSPRWQDTLYRDHLSMQALTLAFQDRSRFVGDPINMTTSLSYLLSQEYILEGSHRIMEGILPNAAVLPPTPAGTNTTHFSIVDKEGNVVSCTSTIEALWGSGLWVKDYGFFLNNELTDFDASPTLADGSPSPNRVTPLARPRSSMSPILVFHQGHWLLAYGSPGGPTIISTLLEVTQGVLDNHQAIDRVIDEPRYAVMNGSGLTYIEHSFDPTLADSLRQLGHTLKPQEEAQGSVQAVGVDEINHVHWGAADKRRDGSVGYQ